MNEWISSVTSYNWISGRAPLKNQVIITQPYNRSRVHRVVHP